MVGQGVRTEATKSGAIAASGGRPYLLPALAVMVAVLTLPACARFLPSQQTAAADAAAPAAISAEPDRGPAPEPAAARVPVLDHIAGMRSQDLVALLGPPDFRRSEPPAELWQYRSADCVLDIFLYRDADDYRVVQSAVRSRHLVSGIEPCTASGALDGRDRRS